MPNGVAIRQKVYALKFIKRKSQKVYVHRPIYQKVYANNRTWFIIFVSIMTYQSEIMMDALPKDIPRMDQTLECGLQFNTAMDALHAIQDYALKLSHLPQ